MEFSGSKNYISTNDLTVAVNASIALEKNHYWLKENQVLVRQS